MGSKIYVKGWIKTKRVSKKIIFVNLNDGSCVQNLQVVINKLNFSKSFLKNINIGCGIAVSGLVFLNTFNFFELKAENIDILGVSNSINYPIQPKKHSLKFLRNFLHLRLRTNIFGSVFRVRHFTSYAIHKFFYEREFIYVHTPIITTLNPEGAGDIFQVTNLNLKNNLIDFSKDFFGKKVYLTVSGQFSAESASLSFSDVYTFGPIFRAENSNTSRHLSEFWMIEPEMSFHDINDIIDFSELFIKYVINFLLNCCKSDLNFLNSNFVKLNNLKVSNFLVLKLKKILNSIFLKISYTNVLEILINSKDNLKNLFNYPVVSWGFDLKKEHESYLLEKYFKKPLVIINYPKLIKPFYMKNNNDNITVLAMDIIFPFINEVIGGSQREEKTYKLLNSINRLKIKKSEIKFYLDTRIFGSVLHSGFGLGLERFLQFLTEIKNIRDVSLFPRYSNSVEF